MTSGIVASCLDHFAIGRIDGRVVVHASDTLEPRSTFSTRFAGILGSLAIGDADDGPIVVTRGTTLNEVVAFVGLSGKPVWTYRHTRSISLISTVNVLGRFVLTPDRGPAVIVDAADGSVRGISRGVREVFADLSGGLAVARTEASASIVDLDPWRRRAALRVRGWTVLAAAFAPGTVLVSDVAEDDPSSVTAFGTDGSLRWRQELAAGVNMPWLSWDAERGEWVGVTHDPDRRVSPMLMRWSAAGAPLRSVTVPFAQDYAFIRNGATVVTPTAAVDSRSGVTIQRLGEPR